MKKVLIGCGVLFVILAALVAGGGYFAVQTFKQVGSEMKVAGDDLQATNRDFPFAAPADGKLSEKQLLTWLKIREEDSALGKQRQETMKAGRFRAMRKMVNIMPDMIKEYVKNLRAEKMSAAEYAWITGQIMGALKSRAAAKDPKTAELAALIEQPDFSNQARRPGGFRWVQNNRPEYAPLAVEDAQPVLDLLKKHEAQFRKVAHANFGDAFLMNMGNSPRRLPVKANDKVTTR